MNQLVKVKRMMETDDTGVQRQFMPITHVSAVLGLENITSGQSKVLSVNGKSGAVILTKADLGLENAITKLPYASEDTDGILTAEMFQKIVNGESGTYLLPIATAEKLGGIKVGELLEVTEEGILSATKQTDFNFTKELKQKLESLKILKAGANISITEDGTISTTNDNEITSCSQIKKVYSNSIDFGDYDYSGNPNLLSTITSDYFTTKDNVTIVNENRGVKLTFRNSGFGAETGNVVQIKPQTTYTLSAKVTVNEDFVGDLSKVRLTYRKFPGGNILLGTNLADTLVGETKMIFVTGSVSEMKQVERTYLRLDSNSQIVDGSINIEYIKLEEASIATPYQPNLFEKPWQISKVPLNENLANQSVVFPINTSTYNLYAAKMKKNLEIGKTMTITLKGTKPVNQSFKLFGNGSIDYGTLTPVNGLVDTWRLTFTPNEVATANPSNIELYQVPKNTLGNCTIEWLKIEEGDVATPNIIDYKYFGEGLKDSDNPNDYSWNITPEYTESSFVREDCVVHNSGNESIDGFKDFQQIPTVNNVPVALDQFISKTVKTTNTTDFTNESSVRFERDGRSVVANFSITNKSANFAGWKNLMAFPKGYTPTSLKDWGGTLANKTNRNPALSVYANASGIAVMVSTTNLPENQECSGTVSYFTNDAWPN